MDLEIKFATTAAEISASFDVVRQLRDKMQSTEEFIKAIQVQQEEGYRLVVAMSNGVVKAAAGFRVLTMLSSGKTLYVDDLVTDSGTRSLGIGGALVQWLIGFARENGCNTLSLDSGVQRKRAHKFYLAQNLSITDFHFELTL